MIRSISKTIRSFILRNSEPFSVFILGMHRSGTSSLTGMLRSYGLYLGSVSFRNPFNPRGNQEGYAVSINEALLAANGGKWFEPVEIRVVPRMIRLRIERFRLQMTMDLIRKNKNCWGVKDPRMLFCWPAWKEKGIQIVGTIRDPVLVVDSLMRRGGRLASGLNPAELYYRYNRKLLSMYRESPFPIVNFDWDSKRYPTAVECLARRLGLKECTDSFFDEKLRHQNKSRTEVPDRCRSLYHELAEVAEYEETILLSPAR